jgi:septal ring factor EnvC (AmiA/AmiB activator)
MQGVTQESVSAIRSIADTIKTVSDIASTIAASVKEQESATQEIARNVQEAASGTQQVSANISEVSSVSEDSARSSGEVQSAANDVAENLSSLQTSMTKILRESMAGNRRSAPRKALGNLPTRVFVNGQSQSCTIENISATGAEISPVQGMSIGIEGALEVPGVGMVSGKVVRSTDTSLALAFVDESVGPAIEKQFDIVREAA